MIERPDRVRVWAAQFVRGDFPPVCAMTGSPADSSGRFICGGGLDWFLPLVYLGSGIRVPGWRPHLAIGRLPLTASAQQIASLTETATFGLFFLAILSEACGLILAASTRDADLSAIARTAIILGLVVAVGFALALVLGRLLPHGRVLDAPAGYTDRLVELRRVHPAFVAAVRQQQGANRRSE